MVLLPQARAGAPNPEGGRKQEKCSLNFDADGGQIPGSEND